MNVPLSDSLLGRQRTRQWTPLITQQFRLRHVYQIFGLNFPLLQKNHSYYYTLHLTTMSAPFYTSDKFENINPKWNELDQRNVPNLTTTAFVIRVWEHSESDSVVATWGVNLSGLVYLGNKIVDIQPACFAPNTVIFNIRGGFFTSHLLIDFDSPQPPPFNDNVNLMSASDEVRQIFRKTSITVVKSEVRASYNINKLRQLHSLQVTIRNNILDVQGIRDKIKTKCGLDSTGSQNRPALAQSSTTSNVRYAPQLLTMKSVNQMLDEKPTNIQKQEMIKIRKEIEIEQFRSKLLSQERDKKSVQIRRFKNKLKDLLNENENKTSNLMGDYYKLSKETDKLKEVQKVLLHTQELFLNVYAQLYHRRKQLLQKLLFIYPIQQISDKKYTCHGIYLPNSDILSDCSDTGISVVLGYITHMLIMSSIFLQVPLRYQMTHNGSRSFISDHVSPILPERDRDFPLFTKGKERIQFSYAVYLLNKNIAQLRWLFFMHTPDLKATLPNLMTFLEGTSFKEVVPLVTCSLGMRNVIDVQKTLGKITEVRVEASKRYNKMCKNCECGPGLSEILAIPEAFINKQISSDSFKNFVASKKLADEKCSTIVIKEGRIEECAQHCDNTEGIEKGTDMLDPSLNLSDLDGTLVGTPEINELVQEVPNVEVDAASNEDKSETNSLNIAKSQLLESWMNNGAQCCSHEDIYKTTEDVVGGGGIESPLTARTDALLHTKSFNLVKPKSNT